MLGGILLLLVIGAAATGSVAAVRHFALAETVWESFRRQLLASSDFRPNILPTDSGPFAAISVERPRIVARPEIVHENRKRWHLHAEDAARVARIVVVTRRGTAHEAAHAGLAEVLVPHPDVEGMVFHGRPGLVWALLAHFEARQALLRYFALPWTRSFCVKGQIWSEADLANVTILELRERVEAFNRLLGTLTPLLDALPDHAPLELPPPATSTGSVSGDPVPIPLFR